MKVIWNDEGTKIKEISIREEHEKNRELFFDVCADIFGSFDHPEFRALLGLAGSDEPLSIIARAVEKVASLATGSSFYPADNPDILIRGPRTVSLISATSGRELCFWSDGSMGLIAHEGSLHALGAVVLTLEDNLYMPSCKEDVEKVRRLQDEMEEAA